MTGSRPRSPLELPEDEMRRLARDVADRVVDRWARLRERPAGGIAGREEMEARLREPLPREGRPLEEVLERFWADVEPFAGKIDHPRFFAFIPSSPTFASLLGDWLAAGCNFFQGTWIESAGPSQVELVVLDWLVEALGLSEGTGGILTSGGSAANLMGLAVAREERLGGAPLEGGVVYGSDQTHTAVDRAVRILGFPEDAFRRLPTGPDRRLDPEAVAAAVARDREAGRAPFCVVANAGTTNTGAVDPLERLADLCREEGLWLHVDGAYGAFARLTERGRHRLAGLERADSLVLDPHKWLYVGYESGCLLVRDGPALARSFHVLPEYLQDTEARSGEVNFADRGLQLTRRARAVALWTSLLAHGIEAVAEAVDRTQDLAEAAERRIRETPELELVSPASLGIVCFRWRGEAHPPGKARGAGDAGDGGPGGGGGREGGGDLDRANARIVDRIQREGRFMISSTRLDGRYVVRLCPLNYRTTDSDVVEVLEAVVAAGEGEDPA